MQLSLIPPYLSRALLLLLMSNLLTWENVASVPRCIMEDGGCQKVLSYIFNMTSNTSDVINHLSSETLNEFTVNLLNVTIRMLAAWKNLHYHVENKMVDLDETPNAIIPKVMLLDRQIKRLTKNLQDIKTILSQVHPELEENEDYPSWSGKPYIQQSKRETQLFGLHSLFLCLNNDAQKISDYVDILKQQIVLK